MSDRVERKVFVEEELLPRPAIQGARTDVTAFLGQAEFGPDQPYRIQSIQQFTAVFGSSVSRTLLLPHAVRGYFENGGKECWVVRVVPRDGARLTPEDFEGDSDRNGLAALAAIDDISLVCAPEQAELGDELARKLVAHCERLTSRFTILSAAHGQYDPTRLHPPVESRHAAFYYPWILVIDPLTNLPVEVPPAGHIAGVYARVDAQTGAHEPPANQPMLGTVGLEFPVTSAMQDLLNPRGVNCLRDFRPEGGSIVLRGARTTSNDPDWRFVSVSRLAICIEQSIRKGLQWVANEFNQETLWARVRRSIEDFLMSIWRGGALVGNRPDLAYFTRCDGSTMTQGDIDNGRLNCLIGIAPLRPAEFVILRIGLWTKRAE